MAVVWVTRLSREGDHAASEREYRHQFLVLVQPGAGDTETTALTAAGVPALGSPHPHDPQSVCVRKSATQTIDRRGLLYTIEVEYSTTTSEDPTSLEPGQTPDQRTPELEVDTLAVEEVITEDLDGVKLRNTAKDFFPPEQRTITRYLLVVRYRRWYHSSHFAPEDVAERMSAVNDAEWRGNAARTVKITGCRATRLWFAGQLYYEVNYELTVRPEGWQHRLVNEGYRIFKFGVYWTIVEPNHDGETDDLAPVCYRPISEPRLLNADGDGGLPATDPPIVLDFRVCPDLDFVAAGID